MKIEDFRTKYIGAVIEIPIHSPAAWSVETAAESHMITQEVIRLIKDIDGLSANELEIKNLHPYFRVQVYSTNQEFVSLKESGRKITLEQFKEDYKSLKNDPSLLESTRVNDILSKIDIKTDFVKKVEMFPNIAIETGFIQAITYTDKTGKYASLYWHPDGRRILFICGVGCFQLSNVEVY